MFVALCGDKGCAGRDHVGPRVGVGLAGPTSLVETDPAGGNLAIRLHPKGSVLPETPTVLSVVTASRRAREHDPMSTHAHVLNSTTTVVPGAALAEQMAKVGDWSPLADAVGRTQQRVFADVGHLHAASPMLSLAARADVGHGRLAARHGVSRPPAGAGEPVGDRPGTSEERRTALLPTAHLDEPAWWGRRRRLARHPRRDGRPAVRRGHRIPPNDPAAVRRLEAGEDPAGRLSRTNLLRTARDAADRLKHVARSSERADVASVLGGG
jgi:hypothetical protein